MFNIIIHYGNANQTTMRYYFTPIGPKNQISANLGKDVEKLEPS